tara:strand:+ start:513782 stop:513898 length:117 start_codon:yes stop_codon:yes gene_type:complete
MCVKSLSAKNDSGARWIGEATIDNQFVVWMIVMTETLS